MQVLKRALLVLFTSAFIFGCSSNKADKPTVADKPASELYSESQTAINLGNFGEASELLEALDTRFPFGPYTTQVQLDLIYVYYKLNETPKALANIDRFLRNNPTHSDLDYVYYMRGLTNMAADHNLFQKLARIDRYDRDPSFSQQAFRDFNTLLKRYPNSDYAADARKRMVFLKNNLARHELSVARYYIKREAYIGAVNRAKYIVEHFPDTQAARDALVVMQEGYTALGVDDLAEQAARVEAVN